VPRPNESIDLLHGVAILLVVALMFALVTGLSLALSYYVIESLIERPFNRLGHVLASNVRRPSAIETIA
jgi:hypothetical protein